MLYILCILRLADGSIIMSGFKLLYVGLGWNVAEAKVPLEEINLLWENACYGRIDSKFLSFFQGVVANALSSPVLCKIFLLDLFINYWQGNMLDSATPEDKGVSSRDSTVTQHMLCNIFPSNLKHFIALKL